MTLPAALAEVPPMEVDPAVVTGDRALDSASALLGETASWALRARRPDRRPDRWRGQAAEAAAAAVTRFSGRADLVATALAEASRAVATYLATLTDLTTERATLVADRAEVNAALVQLGLEIAVADASEAASLQERADRLSGRTTLLLERIAAWSRAIVAAEDALIVVLRGAETVPEVRAQLRGVDVPLLAAELRARAGSPRALAGWWAALTPAQREALLLADPALVGDARGLPARDRDAANRLTLDADVAHLGSLRDHGGLTPAQQRVLANALATQEAIALAETTPDAHRGDQPVEVFLLEYRPTAFGGDGAAAIAYGDPDTAANTAVVVPGFTNDMTHLPDRAPDALNLLARAQQEGASASVISWMGYDAPSGGPSPGRHVLAELVDLAGVLQEGKAEAGGHELSRFVAGLRASDTGGRSHLTVIGHSYGSTTVAHAGVDGLADDEMVLVGSPGAGGGVAHASQLGAPPGHVFVGSAENDPVTWLGRDGTIGLGHDPAQADFGAVRFAVGNGAAFHLDQVGSVGIATHGSYFDPVTNGTSLDNIARIVDGRPPSVVPGRTEPANDHLLRWARDEAAHPIEHGAHRAWSTLTGGASVGLHVLAGLVA